MSQFTNDERGVRNQGVAGTTYGESPASGPGRTTVGHHKHDILNKLDPRVDSTQDRRPMANNNNNNNNVPEGTYGPHSSRIANALDPRVDSDMDGRGTTGGGAMHGDAGAGRHAGPTGSSSEAPEGTYGPHNSRAANALDPRVDSDRDHRGAGAGVAPPTGTVTGTSYGRDAYSGQPGALGIHHQQQAGYGGNSSHHNANPPIAMCGPGPAPNTAGPHRSDLLNKLDPKVDSKAGTGQRRY